MFDSETISISFKLGTLILFLERVGSYILPLLFNKESKKKEADKGASGSLDPSYWKKEFRDAGIEVNKLQILPILDKLVDSHNEIVKMLGERSSLFQKQIDLLEELVSSNRSGRRRRS